MGFINTLLTRYSSKQGTIQKNSHLAKGLMDLIERNWRPKTNRLGSDAHYLPALPSNIEDLQGMSQQSAILSLCQVNIRREVFRNGLDVMQAENSNSDITSSEEGVSANEQDVAYVKQKIQCVNENGQSLLEVLEELEDDFNVWDTAWMFLRKDYQIDGRGELTAGYLKETLRINPTGMGFVINKQELPAHDDQGRTLYFDVRDRSQLFFQPRHPKDNVQLLQAFYYQVIDGNKYYYGRDEFVVKSKFRKGKRGGYPPTLTVWLKARTLLFMDKLMMDSYEKQRTAKMILLVKTGNPDDFEKVWEKELDKVEENPNHVPVLTVPDETAGGEFAKKIELMASPSDMKFMEVRDDMRRSIGAFYGVSPIFQNDVSTSGGLNNEGLQITVTNRTVEYDQYLHNTYYIPAWVKALGKEGVVVRLNPSEEQDEMARLEREALTLQNGQMAVSLGLQAEYDEETGEVKIKKGMLEKQSLPSPFDPSNDEEDDEPPSEDEEETNESSGQPSAFDNDEQVSVKKSKDFSSLKSLLKEELAKIRRKLTGKPSLSKVREVTESLQFKFNEALKEATQRAFETVYKESMSKAEKELDMNVTFAPIDQQIITSLLNQQVLNDSFSNLTGDLIKQVQDVIIRGLRNPTGINVQDITEELKEEIDLVDYKAERIARTETTKVGIAARRQQYLKADPNNEFLYKHAGPNDNRTSPASKELKKLTRNGVTWQEYVRLMQQVVNQYNPGWTVDAQAPITHPNTRHSPLRVVRRDK